MYCITCNPSFHLLVSEQFEAGWMGMHVHWLTAGSDVTVAFNSSSKILVSYSLCTYAMRLKLLYIKFKIIKRIYYKHLETLGENSEYL
jgi:hypothetical protein